MAATPPTSRHAGSPDAVIAGSAPPGAALAARAWLLGGRVRTGELAGDPALAAAARGLVFVFRYGVAVTVAESGEPQPPLDALLAPHVVEPAAQPESEIAEIAIAADGGDRIAPGGTIVLADAGIERLQLVATVLARSVALARHETLVAGAFEVSAPLVATLREKGRVRLGIPAVMRIVGNALAARLGVTGAVQAGERPDLLWDHPALDRLYARLEAEYELEEREAALDRKHAALGDVAEALLGIVQDKRAFHLEIAIVLLIAFEIVLLLVGLG